MASHLPIFTPTPWWCWSSSSTFVRRSWVCIPA
jgi:hypothetical protein